MRQLNVIFILTLMFAISSWAQMFRTTYQARIVKPNGYSLESASVNFRFTVLDPSASCVMYVEDYAAVNMTSSSGLISFALGTGVVSFPASSTATTFSTMFDNSVTSFSCQSPGIYNPISTDNRKIVMQFNDGNGWQTLPAMAINAVPYAMYAAKSQDSQKLNGKADTAFLQKASDIPTCAAGKMLYFNMASFSCIDVPATGVSINSVSVSGSALSITGTASDPVITMSAASMSKDGYLTSLDYAEFKAKLAASSTQIINTLGYAPVSGAAVTTQINNSNLSGDVSGTISSNSVVGVGGKTAAQISTSVNDTLAATSSNTTSTIVKRDSSGNSSFSGVSANVASLNYVDIYKPSTSFNIRLQAPTSLSTNYVLNLPTTSGTTGQVLSTDGAGNLSWINPSTGSVVSVSATAPLASTGGSNPTISITQATSSTNGYLSSADWNTFNNKQAATSAAIIATLGYAPADNAASGTYAQKANNLSDLTSSATARTNLGLGTLATANSIDLGSASATGIIAEARLQTQTNVTSGTQYTKVTVDGKGRVTSGAQLSSSDVTTALGYTPANATSGVTSLNGLTNQTQTFSVGIAGTSFGINSSGANHTFNIPLAASSSVTAGLLSNADYTTFANKQNATSSAIIATLGYTPANATSATQWTTNGSNIYYNTGNIGVGIVNPSAKLELVSGTASVAPLKFTSGTLLSSAQSGTMEYDGFNFYLTDSANTRRTIATGSSAGTIDNASNINSSGNITMTPVGSVIVSSTTASTNSNTGALVVKGGLGVAGNINTAGNLNVSGSSVIDGALKLSAMTSGSVLFAGANGTVTQDNSSLYWDGANKRLGIGSNSPAQTLSVSGTSYFSGNIGIGTTAPGQKLSVSGAIESTSGGFKFPDGTIQTTSAYSGTNGTVISNVPDAIICTTNAGSGSWIFLSGGTLSTDNDKILYYPSWSGSSNTYYVYISLATSAISLVSGYSPANCSVGTTVSTLYSSGRAFNFAKGPAAQWLQSGTSAYYNAGNVGIGTTSPQSKLHVNQGVDKNIVFNLDTSVGTNESRISATNDAYNASKPLWINGSYLGIQNNGSEVVRITGGNVGIGTTNPAYNLEVHNTASGATRNVASFRSVAATRNPRLSLTTINTESGIMGFSLQTDSDAGVFPNLLLNTSGGNVGIGTTSPGAALQVGGGTNSGDILLKAGSSTPSDAGDLIFQSNTGTQLGRVWTDTTSSTLNLTGRTTNTPDVTLKSSGNVGIGTTSPSAKLEVSDSAANGYALKLNQTNVTNSNGLSIVTQTLNSGDSALSVMSNGGASAVLVARNNGNVGIGTASPLSNLYIVGSSYTDINSNKYSLMIDSSGSLGTGGLALGKNSAGTGAVIQTFNNAYLTLLPNGGNVGIGTTAPSYTLHVVGTAGLSTGTAWTNASDRRLKDIQGDYEYGLNEILKLHTVRYNYKKGNALGLPSDFSKTGFIAQEVQKVIPDAVNVRKDGYLELNVDPIHWAVVNAVKDLYKLVVEIKNEILGEVRGLASIVSLKADKAEIEKLKAENAALKSYLCGKDPAASICN